MDTDELFNHAVELSKSALNQGRTPSGKVVPLNPDCIIGNDELPLRIRVELLEELVEKLALQISPLKKQIEELRLKIG